MSSQTKAVLDQFREQARACGDLGSPFTARLCLLLAKRLDLASRFGRRVLEWSGDPRADNIALRACGALHALARSGSEPALTALYPPHEATDEHLWNVIADALASHDSHLAENLDSPPQTNEVARSALILGAALVVANATGLPLEVLEIGASAGLNLGFDHYRYSLGNGQEWGASEAPLSIDCAWRGVPPPLDTPLIVGSRAGCDRNPLDPASDADAERLLSYVWADQTKRLHRVEAALRLAAASHLRVDRADAADWVEDRFKFPQSPGTVRLLVHTIVWQYLPASTRTRIISVLQQAGRAATSAAPVAHFAFEADAQAPGGRMDLTLWPGGKTVTLGRADFHGRWAEWSGGK